LVVYWTHHYLGAFLGVVILSLSGRFNILEYSSPRYALMGFITFTLYMRWMLMPMAYLTWSNLNHSLCGTESDPIWVNLDTGKWYYVYAELYLGLCVFIFTYLNIAICYLVHSLFTAMGLKKSVEVIEIKERHR
jgi:hypothetical protein